MLIFFTEGKKKLLNELHREDGATSFLRITWRENCKKSKRKQSGECGLDHVKDNRGLIQTFSQELGEKEKIVKRQGRGGWIVLSEQLSVGIKDEEGVKNMAQISEMGLWQYFSKEQGGQRKVRFERRYS